MAPRRCSSMAAGSTGDGVTFANAGDDVHAIGPTAPLGARSDRRVVIDSDKTRELGGWSGTR